MTTSGTFTFDQKMVVYLITNNINRKKYVGITRGKLRTRIYKHKSSANCGGGYRLHAAIRKYGWEHFSFKILKQCNSIKELNSAEIYFIAELKPEYNVTSGGEGTSGLQMSDETRQKLSKCRKGRPGTFLGRKHTEESKELMRRASSGKEGFWRGKKRPGVGRKGYETKLERGTISNYWSGKHRSKETIEKISKAKTGIKRPEIPEHVIEIYRENMRRSAAMRRKNIECVEDGIIFDSLSNAAKHYKLCKATISQVALGKRNSVFGKTFRYCGMNYANN